MDASALRAAAFGVLVGLGCAGSAPPREPNPPAELASEDALGPRECDSAMNYAWETTGRVIVTEIDVATFLALLARPSGVRVDGQPLRLLDDAQR